MRGCVRACVRACAVGSSASGIEPSNSGVVCNRPCLEQKPEGSHAPESPQSQQPPSVCLREASDKAHLRHGQRYKIWSHWSVSGREDVWAQMLQLGTTNACTRRAAAGSHTPGVRCRSSRRALRACHPGSRLGTQHRCRRPPGKYGISR